MPFFRVFRTTTENVIVECEDERDAVWKGRDMNAWSEVDRDYFSEPLSDKEVEELIG